jgi:hypothetical protein
MSAENLVPEQQKALTSSQRSDKLWSDLKVRAAELRCGRLTVELVIDGGRIVGAEIISQRERLIT